jgi:hypothetical protein
MVETEISSPQKTRKFILVAILGILVLGFCLRLYDLTDQPIDFHPTRQLRGMIISRGMYYEMLPSADEATRQRAIAFWRSTGQYEPSILERLVAITYLLIGGEYFWIARIFNSLFWIAGGLAVFSLARRMAATALPGGDRWSISTLSGGLALAYYLLLPFSVQASRSFQPDPGMVAWLMLFAFAIYRWSEERSWKWTALAGLLGGMAVLTKAVAAYPVAGGSIAMVLFTSGFKRQGVLKMLRNLQVWSMVILMAAPTGFYYLIAQHDRAAEYFASWTLSLSYLLFQPLFYLRWLNLVQSLVTPVALLLALGGVLLARSRNLALLTGLWVGYILYGFFLPYQMYTHSYYHLQVVPLVALSMVPLLTQFMRRVLSWRPLWRLTLIGAGILLIILSGWAATIPMRSQDNRGETAYWQQIASYLPTDGKILALTQDYGYRLMYYGWRKVILWPNRGEQNLNELRGSEKDFKSYFTKHSAGINYFLITAFKQFEDQPDLKQYLYDNYQILAQGNGYLIFDLTKPTHTFH